MSTSATFNPKIQSAEDQGPLPLRKPISAQPQKDSCCIWADSHDTQNLELASVCTCDETDDENDSSDSASFCSGEQKFGGALLVQQDELQLPGTIFDNKQALSHFVVNVMAKHGWSDVDYGHVLVQECSGFEGRTFKVSMESAGVCPSVVAFHVLSKQASADDVCKGRMAAAHSVFAAHSVSPARLAQGDKWFIDPWIGAKVGGVYDLNRPESDAESSATASPTELGELLARIHAIPSAWYDKWRADICTRRPVLLCAEKSSHIWPFTARQQIFENLPDDGIRLWCQVGPKAASSAGARIVTSHCDFHPANIIRSQKGLQVIDFGLTCVTSAAKDLSWACEYFLHGIEEKREFASAYLKASGLPAGRDEIDALLVDAECFALHSFTGVLLGQLQNLKQDPVHGLDEYFKFAAIAEEALTDSMLRSEILENGLFFSSRYQALL